MSLLWVNVYDFDGTIYNGDSTIDFYFFCLKNNKKVIFILPRFALDMLRYKLKIIDKTTMKQSFYRFFECLNIDDRMLKKFWTENKHKIKNWYLKSKKGDDIVISASPEFLIVPILKELGVNSVIASKVDSKSGKCEGRNCYGDEKVIRLIEAFPDVKIDSFYSDSQSDRPLAELAKSPYLVKKHSIKKWLI